jgi:uncharacterized protein YkwD
MRRFRRAPAAFAVAALLAAPALARGAVESASTVAHTSSRVTVRPLLDEQILVELNRVRVEYHLPLLRPAAGLATSAAEHSREMVDYGFFAHESPGGGAFWRRIARFYSSSGFRRWFVGETILWVSPDVGARTAVQDWLNSPPHRRILLDPSWREVGVSALHAARAPGAFEGLRATVVTADFGVRAR